MDRERKVSPLVAILFVLTVCAISVFCVVWALLEIPFILLGKLGKTAGLWREEGVEPAAAPIVASVACADTIDSTNLDPVAVMCAEEGHAFVLQRMGKIERAFRRGYRVSTHAAELLERWQPWQDVYLRTHPEKKEEVADIEARLTACLRS